MGAIEDALGVKKSALEQIPVKTIRQDTYPALSFDRPELSQAGKNVVVTGGGTGVGFRIATGFAQAGAAVIVLTGRREAILRSAAEKLQSTTKNDNPALKVHVQVVDVTDPGSVAKLFTWLGASNITLDVLVSNAGRSQSKLESVLDMGVERVWEFYEVNVRSHLILAEQFAKQERIDSREPAVMINVASGVAWHFELAAGIPVYAMTKNAGVLLMQQIAQHSPANKLRTVSLHPGFIKSEASEAFLEKYMPGTSPWSSEALLSHFAVWLASPEAAFLHGRYVQADWDVEELSTGEVRKRIDEDPWYLKVGILGLHP